MAMDIIVEGRTTNIDEHRYTIILNYLNYILIF